MRPHELDELGPPSEQLRVEPDGLDQQVDPLISREFSPGREISLEVEVRQLNRLDRTQDPRHEPGVVAVEILDVADAPDATDEKLRMGFDRRRIDDHTLDPEVGELGLVDIVLFVERDSHLVDDPMPAPLFDRRLDQFGLVPVHVVIGENLAHRTDAGLDRFLVVGGGVLAE